MVEDEEKQEKDEELAEREAAQAGRIPLIELSDFDDYSVTPPITEPVTGIGNEGFWGGNTPGASGPQGNSTPPTEAPGSGTRP